MLHKNSWKDYLSAASKIPPKAQEIAYTTYFSSSASEQFLEDCTNGNKNPVSKFNVLITFSTVASEITGSLHTLLTATVILNPLTLSFLVTGS